jgi:hypothetical protein
MVSHTFASWNQMVAWLRGVAWLRDVAYMPGGHSDGTATDSLSIAHHDPLPVGRVAIAPSEW